MRKNLTILRRPEVVSRKGGSSSGLHREIHEGLMTPPVKISERASGWPDYEVDEIIRARIAGAGDDEIREIVRRLKAERKALHPAHKQIPGTA